MNTVAWVAASLACLWLSVYSFNTLQENALGLVFIVVFVLALLMTAMAALDDMQIIRGKSRR